MSKLELAHFNIQSKGSFPMHLTQLTRSLTLASVLALSTFSVAAYAGKHEQAVEAIAQARGKIQAGDRVGTSAQAPEAQAAARAALTNAEDLLARGKKDDAIIAAHHAGDLADRAIISADNRRMAAEHDRHLDAQAATMDAQQSAANANVRADAAQQSAALANSRAESAQMAASAANAQTQALINAPRPAPTTTTVAIVEKQTVRAPVARVNHVRRRIIHRHHAATSIRKTTTVTTTTP